MNFQPSRDCPFCAEPIPGAAKVCPRCGQWLTLRSLRNPVVLMFVHVMPMLLVWFALGAVLLRQFERLGNPGPFYSNFPSALRITESRMNWVESPKGTQIYLTGILTNKSAVDWRGLEFDCRFFDRAGRLIDAGNGHGYLTACAHDETAFRVALQPTAPTSDYASFRISVSTARNTAGWP
jgi:predicted nucleic acid-binding Zn ribbon protein